jgi:hypothetical protein
MNPRIQKITDDIDRTKAKISELQTLLPELERKKTDAENTEIRRLLHSANILPGDIAAFIETIKTNRQSSRVNIGNAGAAPPITRLEDTENDDV